MAMEVRGVASENGCLTISHVDVIDRSHDVRGRRVESREPRAVLWSQQDQGDIESAIGSVGHLINVSNCVGNTTPEHPVCTIQELSGDVKRRQHDEAAPGAQ